MLALRSGGVVKILACGYLSSQWWVGGKCTHRWCRVWDTPSGTQGGSTLFRGDVFLPRTPTIMFPCMPAIVIHLSLYICNSYFRYRVNALARLPCWFVHVEGALFPLSFANISLPSPPPLPASIFLQLHCSFVPLFFLVCLEAILFFIPYRAIAKCSRFLGGN